MNTRRKFLLQGSMATTALLVAKPFTTFANISAPFTGIKNNHSSVVFLHTNTTENHSNNNTISTLKDKFANVMLLHAGYEVPQHLQALKYDVSMNVNDNIASLNNYKIVYKGAVKTGIITIDAATNSAVTTANETAAYLKKEKNCQIVVCLSSLGFRNKNIVDDCTLAANSTDIDMIIGGHADNYAQHAMIALNKNNQEVIIDHAAKAAQKVGQVAISLNNRGEKNNISI